MREVEWWECCPFGHPIVFFIFFYIWVNNPIMAGRVLAVLLLFNSILSFAVPESKDSLATLTGRVVMDLAISNGSYMPPASGAVVRLYYHNGEAPDSLFSTTNSAGVFKIQDIVPQRIALIVSHMGFEDSSGMYEIAAGENAFFLTLKESPDTLSSAYVTAEVPLLRQIKDTTVYNTYIIPAMEDESLRRILESLPGFTVKGNSITVDGRPVTRTYVNGTLVFGDGVTTAIDALKATEVTQVKVYDDLTDIDKHRGLHNGRKQRVIDIITKDAIFSMTLASAGVAGGADGTGVPRYALAGVMQFHSEMFQSSSLIDINNINTNNTDQGYSTQASTILKQRAPLSVYNKSGTVRLDNTKYWKNRYYGNMANVYYSFYREHTRSASTALKEYYGTDDTPVMSVLDTLSNSSGKRIHDGWIRLMLNDTPLKSFNIQFRGKLSDDSTGSFHGNLTRMAGVKDSGMHQNEGKQARSFAVGSSIRWTNNDAKKWRPVADIGADISRNTSSGWTVDTLNTSFLKRKLSSNGYGAGVNAYTQGGVEAMLANDKTKTANLRLFLNSRYIFGTSRHVSLDEYGVDIPVIDMANSHDFTTNTFNVSLDASFNYSTRFGKNLEIGASFQNAYLFDSEILPVSFSNSKHYPSLCFSLRYIDPLFQITASSSPVIPSVEQVRNRVSNVSPIALAAGNPDLRQGYIVQFDTQLNPRSSPKGVGTSSSIDASVGGTISFHPIVAKVRYFDKTVTLEEYDGYSTQAGTILNTFDNSSRSRVDMRAQASYIQYLKGSSYFFKLSLNENYLKNPMFNGEGLSYLDENNAGLSLRFGFRPSSFFRAGNLASSNYLVSYSEGKLLSSRFVFRDSFSLHWFITKRLKFESNYTLAAYKYVAGSGKDFINHFLNAGLTTLIGRSIEIGLWGYDILNTGSLYSVELNSAMMSQTWTPTYGRNIMLQLVYRFRQKD